MAQIGFSVGVKDPKFVKTARPLSEITMLLILKFMWDTFFVLKKTKPITTSYIHKITLSIAFESKIKSTSPSVWSNEYGLLFVTKYQSTQKVSSV